MNNNDGDGAGKKSIVYQTKKSSKHMPSNKTRDFICAYIHAYLRMGGGEGGMFRDVCIPSEERKHGTGWRRRRAEE